MSTKRRWTVSCAVLAAGLVLALSAHAELNLWISYYCAGEDAYGAADYAEAEALLLDASPETARPWRDAFTLNSLGKAYAAKAEYKAAEKCYLCALTLLEESLGKNSREVPMVLNNLADLYYIAGDAGEVEALYRRALAIHERDQRNIEVVHSLNGMALLHNDAGETVQAKKLLERAISIQDKTLRREHPYTATLLVNKAILYTETGRCDEAELLLERAAYIQSQALRPGHPDVGIRLQAQAALLLKMGRENEARAAANHAERILSAQAEKEPISSVPDETSPVLTTEQ